MVHGRFEGTIEAVRGDLTPARERQILDFWSAHVALDEQIARERLRQVVCVALDPGGEVVGVNSVFEELVKPVGRRFWVYRTLLHPSAAPAADELINAAFDALEAEFDPSGDEPLGLCARPGPAATPAPEVIWPETNLVYAGYDDQNRQVRIRYFDDARIGPGVPGSPSLDQTRDHVYKAEELYKGGEPYRVVPLSETADVSSDDVVAMWLRERVIPEDEAHRRAEQVQMVAIHGDEGVVGVTSAYLRLNRQLRTDLWHYRGYVAKAHRQSLLASVLGWEGRDWLSARFASGDDTRAPGIIYEVENPGLRAYLNRAMWLPLRFGFIGENEKGAHVRVHWFPGAQVPLG